MLFIRTSDYLRYLRKTNCYPYPPHLKCHCNTPKSLEVVNFWESYFNDKKVDVFWDTVYIICTIWPTVTKFAKYVHLRRLQRLADLLQVWPTFQDHKGKHVKIQFWSTRVAQIVTAAHVILHTDLLMNPDRTPKSSQCDLLYSSKSPKHTKVGVNSRHFQASWTWQPMYCLLLI